MNNFEPILFFFEYQLVVQGATSQPIYSGLLTVTEKTDFTSIRLIEEIKGILQSQGWSDECVNAGRLLDIKRV